MSEHRPDAQSVHEIAAPDPHRAPVRSAHQRPRQATNPLPVPFKAALQPGTLLVPLGALTNEDGWASPVVRQGPSSLRYPHFIRFHVPVNP